MISTTTLAKFILNLKIIVIIVTVTAKFGLIEYHEPINNNVTPEVKRNSKIYDPPNKKSFRPTIGWNENETHRQGNLDAKPEGENSGIWAFVSRPITNQVLSL